MDAAHMQQDAPRRRDPKDKRERLLKAARELFVANGFEKTTTKQIVQRSGVSEGILYHQFGSKFGIFRVLTEAYAREAIAEFAPRDRGPLRAEQIIRNLIAFADRDRRFFALVDSSTPLLQEHGIPTLSELIVPAIEATIRASTLDTGALPAQPAILAEFQYAIVQATYRGWLSSRSTKKKEAFIREGVRSMEALLRPYIDER